MIHWLSDRGEPEEMPEPEEIPEPDDWAAPEVIPDPEELEREPDTPERLLSVVLSDLSREEAGASFIRVF